MRQTANFHKAELLLPNIRGVREWLSVFPIPPIPTRSFPFPKFMHLRRDLFPFPYYSGKLIPIPSHSHSRQRSNHLIYESKNFKPHNVYNVFRVHSHQKHHF